MQQSKKNHTDLDEPVVEHDVLGARVTELEAQLAQAKDAQLRAIADYQNLQRRSKDELSRTIKFATQAVMQDLLEPLEHLSMTTDQLKNSVLTMVVTKLWNSLQEHGLRELQVLGKPFDLTTMEVVEIVDEVDEQSGVVVKVVKRGYTLNDQVIQHAKVVLGKK